MYTRYKTSPKEAKRDGISLINISKMVNHLKYYQKQIECVAGMVGEKKSDTVIYTSKDQCTQAFGNFDMKLKEIEGAHIDSAYEYEIFNGEDIVNACNMDYLAWTLCDDGVCEV